MDFRLRDNQVLTGELNLDPTFHPLDILYLDEGADGATPSDEIEYESDSSSSDGEQSANNDTQVEETVEQEQEAIAPEEEELQPEQPALPIPETTEQEEGNWLEATEPGMEVEKVNKEDPPEPEYGERHGEIDNENIVESTGVNEQYNLRSRERNQTEATLLHIVNEWRPLDKFGHRYGFVAHLLFVQMSAKKGLQMFGEEAVKVIISEFEQLIEKNVFIPRMFHDLTGEQRNRALRAITLVEQKRNGKLKGRTIADERGQRDYLTKEEAASPTVSLEALFLSCAIDAYEERYVVTSDISGAFLQADMDDFVLVVFEGVMVDLLCQLRNDYKEHVFVTKSGKNFYTYNLTRPCTEP